MDKTTMEFKENKEEEEEELKGGGLNLKLEKVVMIVPARETPGGVLYLSNIDQTVAFPVDTVYFYRGQDDDSLLPNNKKTIVERIEEALRELLCVYYPMAGRIHFNANQGRLEILCNGEGVLFASATSEFSLLDLGKTITFNNPFFKDLILSDSQAIATFQVTTFKCGGFSLGLRTSHILFDGLSTNNFLHKLASISRGEKMIYGVNFERTSLKPRDPPKIDYPHPELMQMPSMATSFTQREAIKTNLDILQLSLNQAYRSFPFPSVLLKKLKEKAMEGGKCSTFEAILAHVWQARVKSVDLKDLDRPTSVLFAMDIRKRMEPPLSDNFVGNGVITAYAQALPNEIRSKPLSFCVAKIREGIERVTSSYVRSAIDWLEVYKGVPSTGLNGNFYLSAWWKLPFHKIDFGFGCPIYAGPVTCGVLDMVLLVSDCAEEEGLNVLITLQSHEMTKFEEHIQV